MKKLVLLCCGCLILFFIAVPLSMGDKIKKILTVGDPLTDNYIQACGECHMAYPPQLLGIQEWRQIMGQMEQHYGDNAELDPETRQQIMAYLTQYNADNSSSYLAKKFRKGRVVQQGLPRISQTAYFLHEHDEISPHMLENNPGLSSMSQCQQCHVKAEQGDFDEDNVLIPGYGRWDD